MKILFTVLVALFTTSIYASSYLNLSCFPQVFNVLGLKKEAKIKFYDNLKLEGEPMLVLSDKFYFKGNSVGHSVFLDKKRKQTNKELFEKLPELIKRKEGVFVAFCPTATEGVFQLKSKLGELYFELKGDDLFLNSGAFFIYDLKEIKKLMEMHSSYKKSRSEYINCIKKSGSGCSEEISENVKLILTFLTRIRDKSCLTQTKKISSSHSEPDLPSLEAPLAVPKSLIASKEIIEEALGVFNFSTNENIKYDLMVYGSDYKNEGGLLNIQVYIDKKHECFSSKEGIRILAKFTYGNLYIIDFDYPFIGG